MWWGGVIRFFLLFFSAFSFFIVYITSTDQNIEDKTKEKTYLIASGIGIVFLVLYFWVPNWKIYKCAFISPSEIKFAGHILDPDQSRPNNYLVLLFRETEEVGRDITHLGKFAPAKGSSQNDGYFEINVNNEYEVNICDFKPPLTFSQSSHRAGFLGIKKVNYIWHYFPKQAVDLRTEIPIPTKGKKYTLVVLSGNPEQLNSPNKVHMSASGDLYVDIQESQSNQSVSEWFSYVFNCKVLNQCSAPDMNTKYEVQNIQLSDTQLVAEDAGKDIVDINACSSSVPIVSRKAKSHSYVHEFKTEGSVGVNVPFGLIGPFIEMKVGFTHGQIDKDETSFDVNVPAGKRVQYYILWRNIWKQGSISIKDLSNNQLLSIPFSVKMGLQPSMTIQDIQCP